MRSSLLAGVLVLAFGGCDMRMSQEMRQMQSDVDRVRDETATHVATVDDARDLIAVEAETRRHGGEMKAIIGDLDDTVDHMSRHCYDRGLGGMDAAHGALDGELAHHAAAMSGATELGAARREVDRHGQMVESISEGMDTAMETMSCR